LFIAGCCNSQVGSEYEAETFALLVAIRSLIDKHLVVKHVFIASSDLQGVIQNRNPLTAWRIDSWVNAIKNLLISVGAPQVHLIFRKWAYVAKCLAIHGASLC